jgi:hypothetical protein
VLAVEVSARHVERQCQLVRFAVVDNLADFARRVDA